MNGKIEIKTRNEAIEVVKHCSAWYSVVELVDMFDFSILNNREERQRDGIYRIIRTNHFLNHKVAETARKNEAMWQLKDHEERQRTISLQLALDAIDNEQDI